MRTKGRLTTTTSGLRRKKGIVTNKREKFFYSGERASMTGGNKSESGDCGGESSRSNSFLSFLLIYSYPKRKKETEGEYNKERKNHWWWQVNNVWEVSKWAKSRSKSRKKKLLLPTASPPIATLLLLLLLLLLLTISPARKINILIFKFGLNSHSTRLHIRRIEGLPPPYL